MALRYTIKVSRGSGYHYAILEPYPVDGYEPYFWLGGHRGYRAAVIAALAAAAALLRAHTEGIAWRTFRGRDERGLLAKVTDTLQLRVYAHENGGFYYGLQRRGAWEGLGRGVPTEEAAKEAVAAWLAERAPALQELSDLFAIPAGRPSERMKAIRARQDELRRRVDALNLEAEALSATDDRDALPGWREVEIDVDRLLTAISHLSEARSAARREDDAAWEAHWKDRHEKEPNADCHYCQRPARDAAAAQAPAGGAP